jgi:hypothetical protein
LEDVSEGSELTVLNLKVVMLHFKECAGSKTAVGAFNDDIIRMCGKHVDGGAGYFINRNDHMLQGYVRIVDPVVDIADVVEPAVDAMVM